MRRIHFLFFIMLFASAAFGQLPATPDANPTAKNAGVEEAYVAKDDGKGHAGDAVTTFSTTDIPIYCVIQLDSAKPVTVKMNFVAVNVAGVKADTKVVTSVYSTKDGQDRVIFTGKPYEKWSAGKYRVDLFLDGKLVKDLMFEIKQSGPPTGSAFVAPKPVEKKPPTPISKPN